MDYVFSCPWSLKLTGGKWKIIAQHRCIAGFHGSLSEDLQPVNRGRPQLITIWVKNNTLLEISPLPMSDASCPPVSWRFGAFSPAPCAWTLFSCDLTVEPVWAHPTLCSSFQFWLVIVFKMYSLKPLLIEQMFFVKCYPAKELSKLHYVSYSLGI